MHQVLEQHIRAKLGTDTAGLEEVISYFQPLELKRNDYLLREGELCRSCYFIVNGVIQVFTIDAVGNETTRDFILEEHWLMDINSFLQQIPSKEFFRAAEPSQVLHISREHFMDLSARFPQFEKMYRQILELSYANSVYRINSFVSMDALERLRWMMDHQPKLFTRLSSKMIASYLGISPETYTRLKGKL